jgi:hypothetical protein
MGKATTPRSDLKRSGTRRIGDDFQDAVALDVLIDWLEHPGRYTWVRVEADDSGFLDDLTAERSDGTQVVRQIKCSMHPEAEDDRLTWDVLLKKEPGTKGPKPSLLQKWASSLVALIAPDLTIKAALVSNRRPSDELRKAISVDQTVDFEAIPPLIRQQVEQQLGGDDPARSFFARFKFDLNHPNLPELKEGVRRRFFRLGGTENGWHCLQEEVANWVCYHDRPNPGGDITLADIKRAAQWYQLQALPQRYLIPTDYVLPSADFHENLIDRLVGGSSTVTVLVASPGSGKSTYTSKLFEDLQARNIPALRHHYFLSLTDESLALRIDHRRAAESLMHDLLREHAPALGDVAQRNPNPDSAELRAWLAACGTHYAALSQRLVLILDGLDHVWRERRSVEELDRLLGLLLPFPPGVALLVATQPVDDAKLPTGLVRAAPRSGWLELPLLGPKETKEWLAFHSGDFAGFEESRDDDPRLERVAGQLYRRSRGHPLHLRYTLRAVQEQGLALDEGAIGRLPECPHEGIVAYYDELWRVIPDEARQILHLFAATRFPWPKDGIVKCLDPAQRIVSQVFAALKQIEHLLLRTDLGFRPFHGSLLAFVSQLPEHADWSLILKGKALQWLRGPAPEHWAWAYTWHLSADMGDEEPLLNGPDRAWTTDAISKCRPQAEVRDILGRALECAAKRHQFRRVIQLGLLKDYYNEAVESHHAATSPRFFARLLVARSPDSRSWVRDHADELADEQVQLLAEADTLSGDTTRTLDYMDVLNRRLQSMSGHQRSSGSRGWLQDITPLLSVAALPGGPTAAKVVRYAARQRDRGHSVDILSLFAERLRANRDFTRLCAVLETAPPGDDGKPGIALTPQERRAVYPHLALLALEEGANCDELACAAPADPFLQIYAAVRKTATFHPGDVAFPADEVLRVNDYELYQHEHEADAFFYSAFFCFLANHLWGRADRNGPWVTGLGGPPWPHRFLSHLDGVAGELATGLRAGRPPLLGEFYSSANTLPRPEFQGNRNRGEFGYGVAAVRATMALSLDLAPVLGWGTSYITKDALEAVVGSDYCFCASWIQRYVASRRKTLTDEALDGLLRQGEETLASTLGDFPERAERFAELASLAAWHAQAGRAEVLLTGASENLLAHGYHKDMIFSHVLSAINAYQRGHPPDGVAPRWLCRLAPPIARVTEFTDGDETRHLPNWLADTMAKVAPELLPSYYGWLADVEEYYDALHALEVFVRTADLTDPVALAVVQTATDDSCLQALAIRSRDGDERAAEALAALTDVMGKESVAEPASDTRPTDQNRLGETSMLPPLDQYPPEKLDEFFSVLRASRYWPQDGAITAWAEYWAAHGRGPNAYASLVDATERGHTSSASEAIYRLAEQFRGREDAYIWLVRAHRELNGWNTYGSSEERASKYWNAVKRHYPSRWAEFLGDTILGDVESRRPAFGSASFERVVSYCMMMGQRQLAGELVEEMVKSSLELVSPLTFPTPGWVLPEQGAR